MDVHHRKLLTCYANEVRRTRCLRTAIPELAPLPSQPNLSPLRFTLACERLLNGAR